MSVFAFLVAAFYAFLGPFLGNRIAENTIITLFSFTVEKLAFFLPPALVLLLGSALLGTKIMWVSLFFSRRPQWWFCS